jgi:hypothetical protein
LTGQSEKSLFFWQPLIAAQWLIPLAFVWAHLVDASSCSLFLSMTILRVEENRKVNRV